MSNDANCRKSICLELIIRNTFQCEMSNDQYDKNNKKESIAHTLSKGSCTLNINFMLHINTYNLANKFWCLLGDFLTFSNDLLKGKHKCI